jgi:hypothetical protein
MRVIVADKLIVRVMHDSPRATSAALQHPVGCRNSHMRDDPYFGNLGNYIIPDGNEVGKADANGAP